MELLEGLKDFYIVKRRGTTKKQDTTPPVITQDFEIKIVKLGVTKPAQNTPVKTQDSETLMKQTNMNKTKEKKPIGSIKEFKKNKHNIIEIFKNTNATPIRRHADMGYACCFCKTSFIDPTDLKIHTIDDHFEAKQNMNYGKYLPELLIKLDITSLQCKICLEYIDSIENLKTHLLAHDIQLYMDIVNYILPFKFDSDELQCAICPQVCGSFNTLLGHTRSHYRNYICDYCEAGFVTKKSLGKHSLTHNFGVFECKSCDKTFDTALRLKMHERGVHKSGLFTCGFCRKKFNNYGQKKRHLQAAHGLVSKVHQCKMCDKSYSSTAMNRHIRRAHLMERQHQCPHCDKAFFEPNMLKEHLATHTDEKNFQCEICLQQFTVKRYLRRHMVKHKEVVFTCEYCDMEFDQRSSWDNHLKSEHNLRITYTEDGDYVTEFI